MSDRSTRTLAAVAGGTRQGVAPVVQNARVGIGNLVPNTANWCIAGEVTHCDSVRYVKTTQVFNFIVSDPGNIIKVTIWSDEAERFASRVRQNATIELSGGLVVKAERERLPLPKAVENKIVLRSRQGFDLQTAIPFNHGQAAEVLGSLSQTRRSSASVPYPPLNQQQLPQTGAGRRNTLDNSQLTATAPRSLQAATSQSQDRSTLLFAQTNSRLDLYSLLLLLPKAESEIRLLHFIQANSRLNLSSLLFLLVKAKSEMLILSL